MVIIYILISQLANLYEKILTDSWGFPAAAVPMMARRAIVEVFMFTVVGSFWLKEGFAILLSRKL